ncbi:MAG: tetratricopeptide repeat protein, partial [Deltaproteobacteria bacterium]|nr:tetratricopeptide repeat protein [Deltaproteobacteria bacterium]
VTMELIDGVTLTQWQQQARSWRDVLAVYLQAGSGLAAAHGKGVTHRDFKPDNVMVGRDDRVRVMDFGLARSPDSGPARTRRERPPSDEQTGLTHSGAVMGTPAYMAPEQHRGEAAGAAADQFAFCVSMFEALYHQRPFDGRTRVALADNVLSGNVTEPAPGSGVPARVRRAILRGLATDPRGRWPSMDLLLAQLDRARRTRRRRVAVGIAVAGAAVAALSLRGSVSDTTTCDGGVAKVEQTWGSARRAAVDAGLRATGAPDVARTSARIQASVDDYLGRWSAGHTAACEATRQGQQSAARLDRRVRCLDGRLRRVHALLELFVHADRDVVHRGVEAVAALPALERCDDDAYLDAELRTPPADQRDRVDALQAVLAAVEAHQDAHKFAEGLARLATIEDEVTAVDFGPLSLAWQLRRGTLQVRQGNAEAATEDLEAAYLAARSYGLDEESFESAVELAYAWGYQRAQFTAADRWLRLAEAEANRLGDARSAARTLDATAAIAMARRDYGAAREAFEQALQVRIRDEGPDSLAVALTSTNLGAALTGADEAERSQQALRSALDGLRRHLGDVNPRVASVLNNLGNGYARTGDYEQARSVHERALSIRRQTLDPDHPDIASSLNALANLATSRADFDQAQQYYAQAAEIWERKHGQDHPRVAMVLTNLAETERSLGQYDKALRTLARALEIHDRTLGKEHGQRAVPLISMGWVLLDKGDVDRAVERFEAALFDGVRLEQRLDAHQGLLYCHSLRGDAQAALAQATTALELASDEHATAQQRTNAQLWVLQAKYMDPPQRSATVADGQQLANELRAQTPKLADAIEHWVSHPHPPQLLPRATAPRQ